MEIEISKSISKDVQKASLRLGLNNREIVARALKLYLQGIKASIDLKEEFDDWDKLSDEALSNFEKSL